jgi:general secretion pathway protein B
VQALGNNGEAAPRSEALGESSAPALPSAATLAAEGVALPPLKLELHAFSTRPRDRFVFINGRKYVEGDRLPEGPQVLSIEPTGAVLAHAGRRFVLVQQ